MFKYALLSVLVAMLLVFVEIFVVWEILSPRTVFGVIFGEDRTAKNQNGDIYVESFFRKKNYEVTANHELRVKIT